MHSVRASVPGMLFVLLTAAGPAGAGSLAVHEAEGIRYVSGGVGQGEREELRALEDGFNLQLLFAARGGAFLSDVAVRIQDGSGRTVVDAVAEGPYFYVALPPGTYVVTATLAGDSSRRKVTVSAGRPTRSSFSWY